MSSLNKSRAAHSGRPHKSFFTIDLKQTEINILITYKELADDVVASQGGHYCRKCRQRRVSPRVSLGCLAVHVIERDGQLPGLSRPLLRINAVGHLGHLGHDGQAKLEEHVTESQAVFFPHQAVDDRVEAAAGEGQAVGQREEVRLS